MSLGTVLIVEDDDAIRQGLSDALDLSGYRALTEPDGERGLETALSTDIDLLLLDLLMPKLDGLGVLERVRQHKPGLPVIILTARGEEDDRVRGLSLGADDYVVKPFSARELLARVEAVLRRSAERPKTIAGPIEVNGRTVDLDAATVRTPGGEPVPIGPREAEVLGYLVANPGRVIEREELLRRVWGFDPRGTHTRSVDMSIARLREHLGQGVSQHGPIRTVRGKGYQFVDPGKDAP